LINLPLGLCSQLLKEENKKNHAQKLQANQSQQAFKVDDEKLSKPRN
jgi:hypothetical protein